MTSGIDIRVQELRTRLTETREWAYREHRRGIDGLGICSLLTKGMDDTITGLVGIQENEILSTEVAVFALGGYGRNELCAKSDVDIMIVHRKGRSNHKVEAAIKQLLHSFWDCGLEIGHSVRSINECMEYVRTEMENWASILEARFICGNKTIAEDFFHSRSETIKKSKDNFFVQAVFDDLTARHAKYGNSAKLLEPNIKNSAGGLRDLHAIFWLFRSADTNYLNSENHIYRSACIGILEQLTRAGELEFAQTDSAIAAVNFLLRTRNEMHFVRETLHDTIDYSLQSAIAEGLGYRTSGKRQGVEFFMQEYYLSAKTILRLNQILTGRFRDLYLPKLSFSGSLSQTRIDEFYYLRNDVLDISQEIADEGLSFEQAMQAFLFMIDLPARSLGQRLRTAIHRTSTSSIEQQVFSETSLQIFRIIIESKKPVALAIYEMADLGMLSRLIPEFEELVAFYQHSRYHYYTADEHTLITLQRLEALDQAKNPLGELYRKFSKLAVLRMTLLLHDIAKPIQIEDHEIIGEQMCHTILKRLGLEDIVNEVAHLIRNHLVMEQISFRRNFYDAQTMSEFAKTFASEQEIDILYLVTYADLAAVNPTMWTSWKAELLEKFYLQARDVIKKGMKQEELAEMHLDHYRSAAESIVNHLEDVHPRNLVEEHLNKIDNTQYITVFSEEEIAEHLRKINDPETVSTIFRSMKSFTELTVIASDAPFALSNFCGVLSANDANIIDAAIFTRSDGIIIDKFRVCDAVTKQNLQDSTREKIHVELNEVVEGKTDIERLFEQHRRKWKRRVKGYENPAISFDVTFEDDPRFTIIDVFAADALGFLYRITRTISKLHLNITFAKIATRGDGIVDTFYVVDNVGDPVTKEQQVEIREKILAAINKFRSIELK